MNQFKRNCGAVELFVIVVVAVVAVIGFSYAKITKTDDSPVEEAAEQVIKNETGFDVDLTPNSPEQAAAKAEAIRKARD